MAKRTRAKNHKTDPNTSSDKQPVLEPTEPPDVPLEIVFADELEGRVPRAPAPGDEKAENSQSG